MAAEVDRENTFPSALWREMGDLGLLGITVPEEYGGSGMGYLAHVVAVEEIEPRVRSTARAWAGFVVYGCSGRGGWRQGSRGRTGGG